MVTLPSLFSLPETVAHPSRYLCPLAPACPSMVPGTNWLVQPQWCWKWRGLSQQKARKPTANRNKSNAQVLEKCIDKIQHLFVRLYGCIGKQHRYDWRCLSSAVQPSLFHASFYQKTKPLCLAERHVARPAARITSLDYNIMTIDDRYEMYVPGWRTQRKAGWHRCRLQSIALPSECRWWPQQQKSQ